MRQAELGMDTWGYEIISAKIIWCEEWQIQYGRTFQAGYSHQI